MIARKQRRPPGKVLYAVFWIGAVWMGLGFIGSLPSLISDFQKDAASAFGVLAGEMVGLAIGVFCVLEIIDANKARRESRSETRPETAPANPGFLPLTPPMQPAQTNPAILDQLKEELFSLESDKISGRITPEEYSEAKALLETRLKLAAGVAIPESIPPVPSIHEQRQAPATTKRTSSLWVTVPILAILCWIAFIVYRRDGISAYSVGEVIGTLLIPFSIAYAVAGAKRRRNWVLFWCLFLGIAGTLSTARNKASLASLSRPDMLKELMGAKPLENNLPENQKEMADATKAFFADMKAARESHDSQVKELEPDLAQVYTATSFSSESAMHQSLNAVDKNLSLDRQNLATMERIPEIARARIDQTNLSDSDKQEFMAGLMKSFDKSEFLTAFQQTIAIESDWVSSTHDLYGFAIAHSSQIVVTKDGIHVANEAVRRKFNEKFTGSEALLRKYLDAGKKAEEIRAATLKGEGLSDTDIGTAK